MTSNELWICANCRELTETGESTAHAESDKPLGLLPEGKIIAATGGDRPDAGIDDYTTVPCDGCGSKLAGMRFMYTSL